MSADETAEHETDPAPLLSTGGGEPLGEDDAELYDGPAPDDGPSNPLDLGDGVADESEEPEEAAEEAGHVRAHDDDPGDENLAYAPPPDTGGSAGRGPPAYGGSRTVTRVYTDAEGNTIEERVVVEGSATEYAAGPRGDSTMLAFERSERIRKQLLDVDAQAAARHRDGKHEEALSLMERAHGLRRRFYGVGSPELERATYDLVTDLNRVSIKWGDAAKEAALEKQKAGIDRRYKGPPPPPPLVPMPPASHKLLTRALALTKLSSGLFVNQHARLRLRAVTYNNMGCLYRNAGKLHLALGSLRKADEVESRTPAAHNRAGTHLNMCAVLSRMDRHDEALRHAVIALEFLGSEAAAATSTATLTKTVTITTVEDGVERTETREEQVAQSSSASTRDPGMVSMAYHNLGVELEFLGDLESARTAFKRAAETALEELGGEHPMTVTMQESHAGIEKRVEELTGEAAAAEEGAEE